MMPLTIDPVSTRHADALAAFEALSVTRSDCDWLTKEAVQAVFRTLPVDCCRIYRRGKDSLMMAAGAMGTDEVRKELQELADEALERHSRGLIHPLQRGGAVGVVIEGDSAPFGVLVAHRRGNALIPYDDVQFIRSITASLSAALRHAHAVRDKAHLRALASSIDDAVIEVTADGRIFNWNTLAERLFGYSRDAVVGQQVTTLLDTLNAEEAVAMLEAVCEGAAISPRDTTWRRADGSTIDVTMRITPIALPDGSITAATICVRDMREQRAADTKLKIQGHILSQMPAALMVWRLEDPNDAASLRLTMANREASVATGCELDGCIGGRFADVAFTPVAVSDAELYASVARTGVPRDLGEHPGMNGQGELKRWYHVYALPLPDNCVGVVFQDVTELRSLSEQFHHAQRLEIVGRLAGGVAHDFNNILTVIGGYTELLRGKLDAEPTAVQDIAEIERAIESARLLTRQLLAFGRRQTLRPAPLDLAALVKSARGMLGRLLGDDIQLCVLGESPVAVMADAGQLDQVLLNLAINSRDAMPAGGKLFVEASTYDAGTDAHIPPGVYGILTISDTGLGMDVSTLGRIFEPFFTTKDAGKGTGLGLSTVHGIVKQSGGHISVTSEAGQGTTFKIYLPLIEGLSIPSQSGTALPSLPAIRLIGGKTQTVLLVEDDDAVRFMVKKILDGSGLAVLEASNPIDALSVARRFKAPIDLLLSDVVMAPQSGPELGNQLKLLFPRLPIIYMSGYVPDGVGHRKIPAGATFLQKPFSPDELMKAVGDLLPLVS